jgi:formiminoglutamase
MSNIDMSVWTGRVDEADGPRALRWHQRMQPWTPGAAPGLVIVGFACDEGVRRNGGRVGAKNGPFAIRQMLANLAWHQTGPVYDAGDERCDDGDMEGAQARLAKVVANVIAAGDRPLVLGGGHETAWGTFQGIVTAKPQAAVGVINIDAHLDLRADEPGNSGTPFNQIAKWCAANGRAFRYQVVGVSAGSNTAALFDRASGLDVELVHDIAFSAGAQDEAFNRVSAFTKSVDTLHLSIDLDVLSASTMPAVSSPAARGVALESVESLIGVILDTGRTAAIDVVELNPKYDIDGHGARVAARLAYQISTEWER